MAIRTTCPGCQAVYSLADQLAGKMVRCKKCGEAIAVRAPKGNADADREGSESGRDSAAREKIQTRPQAPRRSPVLDEDESPRPRRRRREEEEDFSRPIRRNNRGLVIGLIACGVGLLMIFGGGVSLVVLLLSGPSAHRPSDFLADADNSLPPNADAVTRALHQLNSPNPHKRHEALHKLKDTLPDERRPEVVKALEPLLNDPDFFTRKFALEALGVWATKDDVPILLKAMKDKDTRGDAMKALGRLKDERAAEPIAERLEEMSDMHAATEALKLMGPIAEKAVLARLNHHEVLVRWAVCEILEVIGTKQSLPALEKTEANDFSAKLQARKAIEAIRRRM